MKPKDWYTLTALVVIFILIIFAAMPRPKKQEPQKNYRTLENADSVQLETKPYKF